MPPEIVGPFALVVMLFGVVFVLVGTSMVAWSFFMFWRTGRTT